MRVPIELLRCPATGQDLKPQGDSTLATLDGTRSYPIVDGVPILVDDLSSIFTADEIRASAKSGADRGVVRWARRLTPTVALNLGAASRFRRFREELGNHQRKARVLVVGGGVLGEGMRALSDAEEIDLIETDIYLGPRVMVACDGHHLPFRDAIFDGAVVQAVLEHVAAPHDVVAEIHRVLRPDGIVYAETPFMQQVHEGAFDFTRFTDLGHRRLFRYFSEIARGVAVGPGTALLWSFRYFARSFARSHRTAALLDRSVALAFFWLKHFDRRLNSRPGAADAASGLWFLGRKADEPVHDREIVDDYRGLLPSVALRRGVGS
jgi:SAM-dependent methyltransferase